MWLNERTGFEARPPLVTGSTRTSVKGRRESKGGEASTEELGDWRPLYLEGLHEGVQALRSLPWQTRGLWIPAAPHALRPILEGFKAGR